MRPIHIRIVAIFLLGILLSWGQGFSGSDESRLLQGIGYPPVKAGNRAQALLMARRAAVLDAYRNAVQGRNDGREALSEWETYEGFSAFVRDIVVIDEALLADGGVQVTVRMSPGNVPLSEREDAAVAKGPGRKQEAHTGPIRVSEKEWYGIIEQMVRFEGKTRNKGE